MIVERHAIRAILLTPQLEVLLMRIQPPEGGEGFWITPGGGLEPDESAEAGLRRELREAQIVAEYIAQGAPSEIPDVEVLVD